MIMIIKSRHSASLQQQQHKNNQKHSQDYQIIVYPLWLSH